MTASSQSSASSENITLNVDPPESRTLLEIRNLKKYFPLSKSILSREKQQYIRAVDDVSFSIRKGETLALVGESGSGKTTIGLTIAKLYEPTSGDILFDGVNISPLKESEFKKNRRSFQIVFQNPVSSLDPSMKIKEIVAEPLRTHVSSDRNQKLSQSEIDEMVTKLLDHVGLNSSFKDRYPHELSGGQAQRVAIARALSTNPKFLIRDEPTSALDVSVQAQIINLLKKLQREYGLTYLFISHDLSVVNYVSNWVAVLYLGRIVEFAPVEEIFENPFHPYTQALISSVPSTDSSSRMNKIILTGEIPSPRNPPSGCRFHTRCPLAIEKCAAEEPKLKPIEETEVPQGTERISEHLVACHRISESVKCIEKLRKSR